MFCNVPYSIIIGVFDTIMQFSEEWVHSSVKLDKFLKRVCCAHAHCTCRIIEGFDESGLELRQERL